MTKETLISSFKEKHKELERALQGDDIGCSYHGLPGGSIRQSRENSGRLCAGLHDGWASE